MLRPYYRHFAITLIADIDMPDADDFDYFLASLGFIFAFIIFSLLPLFMPRCRLFSAYFRH